jgi:hypothetical protein
MSEPHRIGVHGRRVGVDVRQALLKPGFGHLYPGIPTCEWRPAGVMVDMVLGLRSSRQGASSASRVLDDQHFQFRGRLSAAATDDHRRSRLEDRRTRRELTEQR